MKKKLILIAGPCVLENKQTVFSIAKKLKQSAHDFELDLIFKASFDKANRSSISSYRGPGVVEGLGMLKEIKDGFGFKIITDVHETAQVEESAKVADVLQVPAFLCRQTDLVAACAKTNKIVNIKKGQFMAPWDMDNIVAKAYAAGADKKNVWVTERGSSFGYNRLVVDMISLEYLKKLKTKVIFDVTHSLQLPGGLGSSTGGQREYACALARAAAGVGVDGFFIEVHPNPAKALSDAETSLNFDQLDTVLEQIVKISSLKY